MAKCDIVMLYSGGADSVLMRQLALMAGKLPHYVLIDYGQKHIKELEYAQKQLEEFHPDNLSYQIVKLDGLEINSGLTGTLDEARWDNVHEMNVPARNSMFLSVAAGIAENMGITEVWYGPDYSDRINRFPDCYQEYVVKINEVFAISGVRPLKVVAPLLGMSKELILQILKNFWGIELTDMHSGYQEAEQPGC